MGKSGTGFPGSEVLFLLRGQGINFDAHAREFEARDFAVDLVRNPINPFLKHLRGLGHVLGGKRLVGERHVHHRGGMAFSGREIHKPAVGEHVNTVSVGESEFFHKIPDQFPLR